MIAMIAAAAVLSLTACTGNSSSGSLDSLNAAENNTQTDSSAETTVSEESAQETSSDETSAPEMTKAPDTTTAEQTNVPETSASDITKSSESSAAETNSSNTEDDAKLKADMKALILKYCELYDGLGAGTIDTDTNTVIKNPGRGVSEAIYSLVTDPKYQSVSDIQAEFAKYASGDALKELNSLVFSEDGTDIYKDIDGKLYVLQCGRGGMFGEFHWDEMTLTDVKYNSLTVNVPERQYVFLSDMHFYVKNTNGVYTLDRYVRDEGVEQDD